MPGDGVKRGNDDTLYAIRDGVVLFKQLRYTNFNSNKTIKQSVMVVDAPVKEAKKAKPAEVKASQEKEVKES